METIKQKLEYFREQIRKECISQGEILELQGLADLIDKGDVELLQWAGVKEFEEETKEIKLTRLEVAEHLVNILNLTETATDEVFTNKDKTIGIELVESTIKIYFDESKNVQD